jgi:hypothetical protein
MNVARVHPVFRAVVCKYFKRHAVFLRVTALSWAAP